MASSGSQNIFQSQSNGQGLNNNGGATQGGNIFQSQGQSTNNIFQNNTTSGGNNLFNNSQGTSNNLFTSGGQSGSVQNIFSGSSSSNNNPNSFLNFQSNMQSQYGSYIKEQELLKAIQAMHELQLSPDMHKLFKLLEMTNEKCERTVERVLREREIIKKENIEKDKKERNLIKERCRVIKERNTAILIELLNLKQKMIQKMYQYKVRSPQAEAEL
jgi:hypothetical protein